METVKAGGFIIRAACKDDCEHIMTLVRELGEFTHLSHEILIGDKELERDGFGDHPLFRCVVAECRST
ncbi:hypothetical protein LSH36_682g00044, partial [Paralvinella palmiformis]